METNFQSLGGARLARALGVPLGQKFYVESHGPYVINEATGLTYESDAIGTFYPIIDAIEHPEKIRLGYGLNETEIAFCDSIGAKWVSRDGVAVDNGGVDLWGTEPEHNGDDIIEYYQNNTEQLEDQLATFYVPSGMFRGVLPGDLLCVDEVRAQLRGTQEEHNE